MERTKAINRKRISRAKRVRARIRGTEERPRISVFRSNRYVQVQLIDDDAHRTLAAVSSRGLGKSSKTNQAGDVGKKLADQAKKLGITKAVFDRGAYAYHGRVKALAEALRSAGIQI